MKTIIAATAFLAALAVAGSASAGLHIGAQPPFHRHHHRHAQPAAAPSDTPQPTTVVGTIRPGRTGT